MREKMIKRVELCEKEKQRQKEKHKMMCEKMFKPLSSKPDIVGKKKTVVLQVSLKQKLFKAIHLFKDFSKERQLKC